MNRAQFNKAIVPGLFSLAVDSYRLKEKEATWKKIVGGEARTSDRAYEDSTPGQVTGRMKIRPISVGWVFQL